MSRRRGPYRQYLTDSSIPVPKSTLRRHEYQHNPINIQVQEPFQPEVDFISMERDEAQGENYDGSMSEDDTSSNDGLQAEKSGSDSEIDEEGTNRDEEGGFSELDQLLDVGCGDRYEDLFEADGGVIVQENDPTQRKVLYEGCDLTLEESQILIMSFAIRFALSDLALQSLIELIDCHLPRKEHMSVHLLKKEFPEPPVQSVTHYYCPKCLNEIEFGAASSVMCDCNHKCVINCLKQKQNFFIEIPLKEQLTRLLQDETVHKHINSRLSDEQSDVHSGRVYKRLRHENIVSEGDITLQFNTDGVQIFKSSKQSLWPIQVSVNNLPYQIRKDKILLCGLWLGPKPEMNTYLKPFIDELSRLHCEGLEYVVPGTDERRTVKVHTIVCTVDSQARPMLQKLTTFRGKQGCSFCLHEGEECVVGQGYARVYRGDISILRTHEQHLNDTQICIEKRIVKNGVKGTSLLLTLPVFNIITSFVPDYMHCVLLGVVKSMVSWWQSGVNKNKPFYIGSNAKRLEIDAILCSIMPPCEITRTPRSLTDCKLWKASEWKHFLLYYSPVCLQRIGFPKMYLQHWYLLVSSMHIFLKEKIMADEYLMASKCLRQFVLNMEDIYGEVQLMKFNVHLLLHIPKCVKDFGALWGVSCFPFEHYNGVLSKMFRCSQSVPQQICKFYLRLLSIEDKGKQIFSLPYCSMSAKSLYESFIFKRIVSSHCTAFGENIQLFGRAETLSLTLIQKLIVENFLSEPVLQQVSSYNRFICNGTLFHTGSYKRMKKRFNNVVKLSDGRVIIVFHAILVKTTGLLEKFVLLGKRLHKVSDICCTFNEISSSSFCWIMEITPEWVAVSSNSVEKKCILMQFTNREVCVIPLVNSVERD